MPCATGDAIKWTMLTRSQVARRLGRSLATVRRAEGKALHPTVDGRGVHRFDASEVDALAARLLETGVLENSHDEDEYLEPTQRATREDDTARKVNELRARVAELEEAVRTAKRELEQYRTHVEEVMDEVADAAVLFAPELERLMHVARHELRRRV
jgi:uncharacterized protein YlxW (UPF0749 family)